jgi:RNA polymerase-interacting CarD/CdnL/TRCF family regulator
MCSGVLLHPIPRDASFLRSSMTERNIRTPSSFEQLTEALGILDTPQPKGGLGSQGKNTEEFTALLDTGTLFGNVRVVHRLFQIDGKRKLNSFTLYQTALRALASEYAHAAGVLYADAERHIRHQLVAAHTKQLA